jgi:hypothetical protein
MRAIVDVVSLEVGDVVGGAKLELWGLLMIDPVKDAGFSRSKIIRLEQQSQEKEGGSLGSTPTSRSALRIRFKI